MWMILIAKWMMLVDQVKYHPMVELKIWMPNGFEILTMSLSHPTVRICSRLVRDCVLLPVAF
jgi:hypothetical protein